MATEDVDGREAGADDDAVEIHGGADNRDPSNVLVFKCNTLDGNK